MGTVAVDSDVIIAFLEPDDPQHNLAVAELQPWLESGNVTLIPASVYAEVLVWPIRAGLQDRVEAFISEGGFRVVPIGRAIARQAAELRAKHFSLRLPDALAMATATSHGAVFLTLDLRLKRLMERESQDARNALIHSSVTLSAWRSCFVSGNERSTAE
jgi:predicted nucleic acid-binding protein